MMECKFLGKHVGIAAITAEGAALAFTEVVHCAERVLGTNVHPEISLHSFSLSKYLEVGDDERLEVWGELIIQASQKLAAAGAEFFICPANTNHIVYDDVQGRLAIPWLHIADIVAQEAVHRRCRNALILGTKFTMQSDVYGSRFAVAGIGQVTPTADEQELLHTIIYKELVSGLFLPVSKAAVLELIARYQRSDNCDSVVLGCTELPLLVDPNTTDFVALDSTRLVAQGAVAFALGKKLVELSST